MKRVLAVSVLALVAAGCAVPGQELDPGTAFAYGDMVLTEAQVDSIYNAWIEDTRIEGTPKVVDPATRAQVMTLEAMHDPAVAAATPILEEAGFEWTADYVDAMARQWLDIKGAPGDPSPEVLRQVETALALWIVSTNSADGADIIAMAEDAAEGVVGSPRAGIFSADAFVTSVINALNSAQQQDLQSFGYITFQDVDGFIDAPTSLRQKEPGPSVAPEPSVTP